MMNIAELNNLKSLWRDACKDYNNISRKIEDHRNWLEQANAKLRSVKARIPKYDIRSYEVETLTEDQIALLLDGSVEHDFIESFGIMYIDISYVWSEQDYALRIEEDSAPISDLISFYEEQIQYFQPHYDEAKSEKDRLYTLIKLNAPGVYKDLQCQK